MSKPQPPTTVMATPGWHRFVSGLCLLACIGFIVVGIARLLDPTEGRGGSARPMDYLTGIGFIALGASGIRFFIRQIRASKVESTRQKPDRSA